jgi:hypothetical protein
VAGARWKRDGFWREVWGGGKAVVVEEREGGEGLLVAAFSSTPSSVVPKYTSPRRKRGWITAVPQARRRQSA